MDQKASSVRVAFGKIKIYGLKQELININMTEKTRYEVITQENADGDLIIPIPPPLLKSLGWSEETEVDISVDEATGQIFLKKADK